MFHNARKGCPSASGPLRKLVRHSSATEWLRVNILADAVKLTLGPQGRNVILERSFGAPTITNDGISVAKKIELHDQVENMGAQLVREVVSKHPTPPSLEPR